MTQRIPEWFHPHGLQTELQEMQCCNNRYTLPIRCLEKNIIDAGILIWHVSGTWWSLQYQRRGQRTYLDLAVEELEGAFGLKRKIGTLCAKGRSEYSATHVVFGKFIRNRSYLALPGPLSPDDTNWNAQAVSIRINSKIRAAVRELISNSS